MPKFPYRTTPFEHQREALRETAYRRAAAWLLDPRMGKAKLFIDNVGSLFLDAKIGAGILLTTSGADLAFALDEVPKHMPLGIQYDVWHWNTAKHNAKWYRKKFKERCTTARDAGHLFILVLSYGALTTHWGQLAALYVIHQFQGKVLIGADESTKIKSPSSVRGRAARRLARMCDYKRIMTGTVMGDGDVLDLYGQFEFLGNGSLGARTYKDYQNMYLEWEERDKHKWDDEAGAYVVSHQYRVQKKDEATGLPITKNLDRLQARISKLSFRATRDGKDLPAMRATRYFDLPESWATAYNAIQEEYMYEVDSERTVYAELPPVRVMRLHQVCCGYVGLEADEPVHHFPLPSPRLEVLAEVLEEYRDVPTIVWCRFRLDVDLVLRALTDAGASVVRYDGLLTAQERRTNLGAWQRGVYNTIVANMMMDPYGLKMDRADLAVYYSQTYSLEQRVQSEDRMQSLARTSNPLIIDIVARGRVDERIIRAHNIKRTMSNTVLQGVPA